MRRWVKAALVLIALPLVSLSAAALSAEDVASSTAVLMDADTGQVLYDKNMSAKVYPASTTKIMTGLLVSELCAPDETLTASRTAIEIDEWGSTNIGLAEGESLTVESALYALMLASANDVANALAEHAAGSQEAFVALMNQRAAEIGAVNTHFANPHGLHNDTHYTTAYDMALITRHAAGSPAFMDYFAVQSAEIPPTNRSPIPRDLVNYHSMLMEDSEYYDANVLGGKVGYTSQANHTMSTIARQGERTLICVVMDSTDREEKFSDTKALLEYGFTQFDPFTLTAGAFSVENYPMEEGTVSFESSGDFTALLRKDRNAAQIQIDYGFPAVFSDDDQLPGAVAVILTDSGEETLPVLLGWQPVTATLQPADAIPAGLGGLMPDQTLEPIPLDRAALPILLGSALFLLPIILLTVRKITLHRRRKERLKELNARMSAHKNNTKSA